jgi:hypothetical protein
MPFSQATRQALFDEAATAVLRQGRVCKRDNVCVYDDGAGNHCAIGHILKARGVNLESLRNAGIGSALRAFRNPREHFDSSVTSLLAVLCKIGADCGKDIIFLQDLQLAHDGSNDIPQYKRQMRQMATDFGLSAAALAST